MDLIKSNTGFPLDLCRHRHSRSLKQSTVRKAAWRAQLGWQSRQKADLFYASVDFDQCRCAAHAPDKLCKLFWKAVKRQ